MTSCNVDVDTISQHSTLSRLRWYGTQTLKSGGDAALDVQFQTITIAYHCPGQGTYTYKNVTNGLVEYAGIDWKADAYDTARFDC